jgi:hypothetical protein
VIVDGIRALAGWLTDATSGVNAQLAALPKDVGDAAPPDVAHVYTEADHAVTALGPIDPTLVEDGPVLLVCFVGTATEEIGPHTAGAVSALQFLVRYAAEQDDPREYARDGWQTLRAATRSLRKATATTRNRVVMDPPARVQLYAPPPGGEAFVPALLVTVPATDAWALGA